jgi:hypothetical protein
MRSCESVNTSNSGVASWTDSTAADTITTRHSNKRNQLSIIQEYGDSNQVSTDSIKDHIAREYSAFSRPLKARPSARKADGTVDTQRVYSALIKRIDQTATQKEEGRITVGTVQSRQPVYKRAASVRSECGNPSIRQVPSDLSMKTARTSLVTDTQPQSAQSRLSLRSAHPSKNYSPTPQQGADCNGSPSQKRQANKSLEASDSTFFQSGSYSKAKTPSPYKLAMGSILRNRNDLDDDSSSVIVSRRGHVVSLQDSPSVYSRTPSGNVSNQELPQDCHDFSNNQERGVATIFTTHRAPYRSPRKDNSPLPSQVPTRSSADWKTWVDSQIARIDSHDSIQSHLAPLSKEHYREDTQIDSDEPQHTNYRSPLMELKLPMHNNFSRLHCRPPSSQISSNPKLSLSPGTESSGIIDDVLHPLQSTIIPSPDFTSVQSVSSSSAKYPDSPTLQRHSSARREALSRHVKTGTPRPYFDMCDAKSAQFHPIRSRVATGRVTNENSRDLKVFGNLDVAERHPQLQGIHSTISSKRMVELFLSSRRYRREDLEDDDTSSAFL